MTDFQTLALVCQQTHDLLEQAISNIECDYLNSLELLALNDACVARDRLAVACDSFDALGTLAALKPQTT